MDFTGDDVTTVLHQERWQDIKKCIERVETWAFSVASVWQTTGSSSSRGSSACNELFTTIVICNMHTHTTKTHVHERIMRAAIARTSCVCIYHHTTTTKGSLFQLLFSRCYVLLQLC